MTHKHSEADLAATGEIEDKLRGRIMDLEAALTACEAERDELTARLAIAIKCGEEIYGMLQAHQQNVDEWLDADDQALVDSWFEDLPILPARARQIMDIVREAVRWEGETIRGDDTELVKVVRAHQQQDTPS